MISRYRLLTACLAVYSMAFLTAHAEPAATPDPVATGQQAFSAIAANQPERLWDLLPASYQVDIQQLMTAFATSADADTWNRIRGLTARLSLALDKQKDLIFQAVAKRKVMTDEESDQLRAGINALGKLTGHLAVSPLTNRERLQQGDLRDLLAGEGQVLLSLIETLSTTMPDGDNNFLEKARHARVEPIEADTDQARVRVTLGDEVEEINLTIVENRWIPDNMAENWQQTTDEMRERIAAMDPTTPEGQQARMQNQMVLGMIDGMLTAFEQAKSEEDLDQIITGLLMMR